MLLCGLAPAVAAGPVTVGIRGGSGIPDLHDNGGNEMSAGYSSRVAPTFGGFVEYGFTPTFSVQAEFSFVGQGGRRDGLQPLLDAPGLPPGRYYANFKNTAKLNYLEIPVLAKYHFGGAQHLFVGAGPYVGFLLSAQSVTHGTSPIYTDAQGRSPLLLPLGPGGELVPVAGDFDQTMGTKGDLNSVNWGFQGGAGYGQEFGPGMLILDVRASLGLTNIQRDTAANGKSSTGDLVVALAYAVRLGGSGGR